MQKNNRDDDTCAPGIKLHMYLKSVAKCRWSWVVGRGRGLWVWVSVVGKNKTIVAKFMKKISII